MNANTVVKNYAFLTPEERFQLILAASGRGDEAEQERLVRAGDRVTLSMSDHAPYAHAFDELAWLTFLELLEEAARYHDAFERSNDVGDLFDDDEQQADSNSDDGEDGDEAEATPGTEDESDAKGANRPTDDVRDDNTPGCERFLDLALAAGYVLRAKAEGWKLFCQRLNIPPFLLWEMLPGFDRLQRALALAEKAAFVPEGFLRWLNHVRPAEDPKLTAVPLIAEAVAKATEEAFRQRVQWRGG